MEIKIDKKMIQKNSAEKLINNFLCNNTKIDELFSNEAVKIISKYIKTKEFENYVIKSFKNNYDSYIFTGLDKGNIENVIYKYIEKELKRKLGISKNKGK